MKTKMEVTVSLRGDIDRHELEEDLKEYECHVVPVGNRIMVKAAIDIREDTIEKILTACAKYGDNEVQAHTIK